MRGAESSSVIDTPISHRLSARLAPRTRPMTTNPPSEAGDEPLQIGDRIYDRWQLEELPESEHELAVVIGTHENDDVHSVTFTDPATGEETSLADYGRNQRYVDDEASDRVVTIAFESTLDAFVPRWRNYADDGERLERFLRKYTEEWSIDLDAEAYDYPEARLTLEDRPSATTDR